MVIESLENRVFLNSAYQWIAGDWECAERQDYKCTNPGETFNESHVTGGKVTLTQNGEKVSLVMGYESGEVVERKGVIKGNHVTLSGKYLSMRADILEVSNQCSIQGDLVGNQLILKGKGMATGFVGQSYFTLDGTARFELTRTLVADSFEYDDKPQNASLMTPSQIQYRSIDKAGNTDWAAFYLNNPSDVALKTLGGADLQMWLYGPGSSTKQVAFNDDGSGKNAAITCKGAKGLMPGVYYVKVKAYNAKTPVSVYGLQLSTKSTFNTQLRSIGFGGTNQIPLWDFKQAPPDVEEYKTGDVALPFGEKNPIWVDKNLDGDSGDSNEPASIVAYYSGAKIKLNAKFAVTGAFKGNLKIRAVAAIEKYGSLTFEGVGVQKGKILDVTLNAKKALPGQVLFSDTELTWSVSYDSGKNYYPIQSTRHILMSTLAKPILPKNALAREITTSRMMYATAMMEEFKTTDFWAVADFAGYVANSYYDQASGRYQGLSAWSMPKTNGDSVSCANFQKCLMNMVGLPAEVKYITPRHSSWTGFYSSSTAPLETNPQSPTQVLLFGNSNDLTIRGIDCLGVCQVTKGTESWFYQGIPFKVEKEDDLYVFSHPEEILNYLSMRGYEQYWCDPNNDFRPALDATPISAPAGDMA